MGCPPDTVTFSGAPNGHMQTIQSSDGRAGGPYQQLVGGGPPQLSAQEGGGQLVNPHVGMTYLQVGSHPILHNGQIIFQTRGSLDHQALFVQAASPHQLQPHQLQQQQNCASSPMQQGLQLRQQEQPHQQQQHLQQVRQVVGGMPEVGDLPPVKTAISQAIFPFLPKGPQTTTRMGNDKFPNQHRPMGATMKMVPVLPIMGSLPIMPASSGSPGMMPPGNPRPHSEPPSPPSLSPMQEAPPDKIQAASAQVAHQQAAAQLPSTATMSAMVGPNLYPHLTNKPNRAPQSASLPSQHRQPQVICHHFQVINTDLMRFS